MENRTESSGVDGTCQALVGSRNEPGCPVPSLQWHWPGDQSLRGRAKASTTLPLRTYRGIIVHGAEMQRTQERATLNASRNMSVLCQCLTRRCVRGVVWMRLPSREGDAHGPQCPSARGWWGIHPHEKITVILWEWVRIPMTLDLKTNIMSQSTPHFLPYQGFSLCAQKSAFVGMGCSSVGECCPLCVRPWVCSLPL